jgi:hypothetical protein
VPISTCSQPWACEPASLSTVTGSPVRHLRLPSIVLMAQGIPSSRATMRPWDKDAPMSMTTAAATDGSGLADAGQHAGQSVSSNPWWPSVSRDIISCVRHRAAGFSLSRTKSAPRCHGSGVPKENCRVTVSIRRTAPDPADQPPTCTTRPSPISSGYLTPRLESSDMVTIDICSIRMHYAVK